MKLTIYLRNETNVVIDHVLNYKQVRFRFRMPFMFVVPVRHAGGVLYMRKRHVSAIHLEEAKHEKKEVHSGDPIL